MGLGLVFLFIIATAVVLWLDAGFVFCAVLGMIAWLFIAGGGYLVLEASDD